MTTKPALDRTKMKRFTSAVRQRNQNFHDAAAMMRERSAVTTCDVQDFFQFKGLSAARTLLREFLRVGLATVSEVPPPGVIKESNANIKYYSLTALADVTNLHELYPLSVEGVELDGKPYSGPRMEREEDGWKPKAAVVQVRRDPLVAFIHGNGPAPSLNFRSQQQGG